MRKWLLWAVMAAGPAALAFDMDSREARGQAPVINAADAVYTGNGAVSSAAYSGEWLGSIDTQALNSGPQCEASSEHASAPAALFYGSADYLLWWTKGTSLPPLVTSSPAGTPRADAAILGLPATSVLFGGAQDDNESRSGVRARVGRWLDDCACTGVEAGYFGVFHDSGTLQFAAATAGPPGTGLPILGRPFFDTEADIQNAQLVSFLGLTDGSISVLTNSEFHSANLSLRRKWREGEMGRIDLLGGYRYFRFRDSLRINSDFASTSPVGNIAQGTSFSVFDDFAAENDFHGGELGAAINLRRGGRFGLDFVGKVALGNLHRAVAINGQTTVVTPGPNGTVNTADGGLLALSTNSGRTTENSFGVLPEFQLNATFDVTECWSLQFGYTFLLLNQVARAGEQVDLAINPNFVPGGNGQGTPAPVLAGHNTGDFWAQGLNFGIQGRF